MLPRKPLRNPSIGRPPSGSLIACLFPSLPLSNKGVSVCALPGRGYMVHGTYPTSSEVVDGG